MSQSNTRFTLLKTVTPPQKYKDYWLLHRSELESAIYDLGSKEEREDRIKSFQNSHLEQLKTLASPTSKLEDYLGSPTVLLDNLWLDLENANLNSLKSYAIDHLCYRVTTAQDYTNYKNILAKFAVLLSEAEVNGRLIATYKLIKPIKYDNQTIYLIELPSAKPNNTHVQGWQHAGLVIEQSLVEFQNTHTELTFDIGGINKQINPELEINLANSVLKLHNQSLESIIAVQEKTNIPLDSLFLWNLINTEKIESISKKLILALDEVITQIFRENILDKSQRPDGRRLDQTRQITSEVGVLPITHGSSLFQRGETQVLNILTLGTDDDSEVIDNIEVFEQTRKRYIHHYNFPQYSVGSTGRYTGPGRREIGHGALAEKALLPVLPTQDQFPYTIRLVSECLGSNGSTSMASTCASTLSLMDGGVPIKDMVGGVAMGLVVDKKTKSDSNSIQRFQVLTDIAGLEDHHGDMDFKVTGTKNGITAIQLDNKAGGVSFDILKQALNQALDGRIFILNKMQETITLPRDQISDRAPRVRFVMVPMDKVRDVIGKGGDTITGLERDYGVEVNLENETGRTSIYGKNAEAVEACYQVILGLIKEYQVGETILGSIVRIESYGCFVKFQGSERESMMHISNLSKERVAKVEDVVGLGDEVECSVVNINEKGQIDLRLVKVLSKSQKTA